eukprot:5507502-Prorocentrum_lima.AAC.1
MTSSLVGSEMCIRDSPFPPSAAPPQEVPREDEVVNPKLKSRSHRFPAVSYTHLTLPTICSV